MSMSSNNSDDEITDINVTPLVDVMMVLLIIFMVTANYMTQKSINVKLPKASSAAGANTKVTPQNLAFALSGDGQLYLNNQAIKFEDISALIEKMAPSAEAKAKLEAMISADQTTPHGTVVKLIEAVRSSGVDEFAINVQMPEN